MGLHWAGNEQDQARLLLGNNSLGDSQRESELWKGWPQLNCGEVAFVNDTFDLCDSCCLASAPAGVPVAVAPAAVGNWYKVFALHSTEVCSTAAQCGRMQVERNERRLNTRMK